MMRNMSPLSSSQVLSKASFVVVSLAMASCGGGGGGGGSTADSGVNSQLRGALGEFQLMLTPDRDVYVEAGRLMSESYGGSFMDYGLSEGRVLSNGLIQFCDVVPSTSAQDWRTQWDGSTSVATSYQFSSSAGDVGGYDVWVARSSSSQATVMQGSFFTRAAGVFNYDPDRWDIGGYVHLSDGTRFLAIDRQSQISHSYDLTNIEANGGYGFIEPPFEPGDRVVIGQVEQGGACLHYVLDASGSIVSGRRYLLGWSGGNSYRSCYIDHYGPDRYVVRYSYGSSFGANFVFNSAHQLERVTEAVNVQDDIYFSRVSPNNAVTWQSEQFVGDATGWRVMSVTLDLPGQGPNSSGLRMDECGGLKIGAWPNTIGGVDVVAIGAGGRVEWARSYEVDCTERDESYGGDVLLLRSYSGGSNSTRYLRLNPSNGSILASYEVQHGMQFAGGGDVVAFPSSGGALSLLSGSNQPVLVTQANATALPSAWRLQNVFQSGFVQLYGEGGIASVSDDSGASLWVSAEAVSRAAQALDCTVQVPVTQLFVRSTALQASTQAFVLPDLQVTVGAAASLQPLVVQTFPWSQPCTYETVDPLDTCLPTFGFQRAPSSPRSDVRKEREPKGRDRSKQKSRR